MKKIMFNDRYGLTQAVLERKKTMTRRIVNYPKKFKGVEDTMLEFNRRIGADIYYDCVVCDAADEGLTHLAADTADCDLCHFMFLFRMMYVRRTAGRTFRSIPASSFPQSVPKVCHASGPFLPHSSAKAPNGTSGSRRGAPQPAPHSVRRPF